MERLSDEEKALLADKRRFYVLDFENVGGLVSPLSCGSSSPTAPTRSCASRQRSGAGMGGGLKLV